MALAITETTAQVPVTDPSLVPPPNGVTVQVYGPIPELAEVIDLTKKLNDSILLTHAGNYSNYYRFSITRWAHRRTLLAWRNQNLLRCNQNRLEATVKRNSVEELDQGVLSGCLTLSDVRELAVYELPNLENPDQIGGTIRREVVIGVGALPHRVDLASFAVESLLIFTLLYFGAFLREATSSDAFPAAGTLFSAFLHERVSNAVMLLALILPPTSSLIVAIASRDLWFYAGFLVASLASWWIFAGFQKKAYFDETIQSIRSRLKIRPKQAPKSSAPPGPKPEIEDPPMPNADGAE